MFFFQEVDIDLSAICHRAIRTMRRPVVFSDECFIRQAARSVALRGVEIRRRCFLFVFPVRSG